MIMIPRTSPKTEYYWPIPEDYFPSATMSSLPARLAHAPIKFQTTPCPTVNDRFPCDKYELEPSPLTQYILERRQSTMAWPVTVDRSEFDERSIRNILGLRPRLFSAGRQRIRFTLWIPEGEFEFDYRESLCDALQLSRIIGFAQ